ncbi:MAG: helix-hairpin-helix domain-containing protein [Thermodesulfobacteriota bacterium]
MDLRERQKAGGLVILTAALVVHAGMWFHARHPAPRSALPWENQNPQTVAVEIAGIGGAEGIYFLPESSVLDRLSLITGARAPAPPAGASPSGFSSPAAFRVTAEGGKLTITDMPAPTRLALGLPIDVNRATQEELMLVPGIGQQTADRIVRLRQSRGGFDSLSDLTAVSGIKEKRLRALEKYLTAGTSP